MDESFLLEAVPGGAARVDREGRLESLNQTWLGANPGNPFMAGLGVGTDYLQHCRALTKSASGEVALVALGIVSAIKGVLRQMKLEYPLTVDGKLAWFAMTITPGPSVVIAHLDITERMLWEQRMRRSEQLFRAITDNALDLLAIIGAEFKIVYVSPSYGKSLGHPPATLVNASLLDLVCPEDRAVFEAQCRTGFQVGCSPLFEYRVLHGDGSPRYLEARAVAVENQVGGPDSILLTSRDVSAKKAAESQKAQLEIELRHGQKMEAIGQLSAGIAHEINTPCQYLSDNMGFLAEAFASLQTVLAAVASQLGQAPPVLDLAEVGQRWEEQDVNYLLEEVPRAIAQSKDGLSRISTIVKAMKVFAHPGGETKGAVDLNEALQNTLVVAQSEWKYHAEVVTDLAPELPKIIGSQGELNQVFLNLIVNAAHAIAERRLPDKGRITVSSRRVADSVEIAIRDTGAGIPEAIREQIFLPFFTTKEVGKGTGQGLAIVHSVISKHGGTIGLVSELGQGTCFTLRLPLPSQ